MIWVLLALYQILATAGFILALPYLLVRAIRHPREMGERLGWGVVGRREESSGGSPEPGAAAARAGAQRPLWLHAASLGEYEALRALLEDPRMGFASPTTLTVTSVSARRRVPELPDRPVRFAPADLWFALLPFLLRLRPRGLVLTETELWPCTLAFCRLGGIPVALVNGRLSPRRWSRTLRLRALLRPLVGGLDGISTQSEADGERFRQLGSSGVSVGGNLKYKMRKPREVSDNDSDKDGPNGGGFRPDELFVFVAGSLRLGEEEVLDLARSALDPLEPAPGGPRPSNTASAGIPRLLLVAAPRHLRERDHWLEACRQRDLRALARSTLPLVLPDREALDRPEVRRSLRRELEAWAGQVLLIDTHGELGLWYAVADAAFVGGTLVPIGGHNLFEPAREGVPVAFGPFTEGVAELAGPLLRHGGGERVRDAAELSRWAQRLLRDPAQRQAAGEASRAAAEEAAGGVARTWEFLSTRPWTGVRARVDDAATAGKGSAPGQSARPADGAPRGSAR